jgi:phosphocarrier protein
MRSEDLVLRNRLGLHARASAKLVHCASRFVCDVRLGCGGQEVEGKSILGLLLLAAPCGETVTVTCDGPDEDDCFAALAELIEQRFGEDD